MAIIPESPATNAVGVIKVFIVPHPPLIIPEIGKGGEKRIQNTVDAYQKISREIADIKPETVVVLTPHSVMYKDYIHISPGEFAEGDFGGFGADEIGVSKAYDREFVSALEALAKSAGIEAGTLGERDSALDHGVLVPLYFLEHSTSDYRLVRISISGLPFPVHYRFGQCIAKAAESLGRKTVLIASGDLSHKLSDEGPYGYASEGPAFDKEVTQVMKSADFIKLLDFDESFCDAAAECGLRAFIMMAGALDGRSVAPEFLSYEGPFGVGYAVCAFTPGGADENRHFADRFESKNRMRLEKIKSSEDAYVHLARASLETYIRTGKYLKLPSDMPDDVQKRRAGVFVSLKKNGRLRGCIGTIEPTRASIGEEIIKNAVSAGTGDPRFEPVTESELASLVYSVDILSEPEPAHSVDDLDERRYGVIVSRGYRRGLLLPNIEGVNSPEEQIAIALSKAGIAEDESYDLERFEVVRHK
ncbi:MAG: AmmeMemoRadiSam system protein A [Eubacteriales bacterium]|nr:AmmeMemoRadiSam system protein A [Eubacteriales bacterium]